MYIDADEIILPMYINIDTGCILLPMYIDAVTVHWVTETNITLTLKSHLEYMIPNHQMLEMVSNICLP